MYASPSVANNNKPKQEVDLTHVTPFGDNKRNCKRCYSKLGIEAKVFSYCRRFDTLCVLPTCFGKSLIYQLLPAVFKRIKTLPTEAEQQQPTFLQSLFFHHIYKSFLTKFNLQTLQNSTLKAVL